ncbi:twin-arginine translocation signal domain-containing protein, partial [Sandarakinorhabdus limnophila]
MSDWSDRTLGMNRPIARRDFISGVAVGVAASGLSLPAWAAEAPDYPPLKTGLRGQYPGSFETAHMARDGSF